MGSCTASIISEKIQNEERYLGNENWAPSSMGFDFAPDVAPRT